MGAHETIQTPTGVARGTRFVLPDAPPELQRRIDTGAAVAWREPVSILTYDAEAPSPFPMFLDHRVYQGSSGRVYPLPFHERIAETAVPRAWDAIHLENAYVRLMVLPELGGRIHVGYDKVTGYDFFYRNNAIKPALVGLTGPWVSGGVEFNWPQHHRPATALPVDVAIQDDDEHVTVWCHDHDPFARMSAHHGIRLRRDSALIELDVRLHNRTDERQSFLWWANVAAAVHDDYQAFFPEDVRHVADHARRAMTAFPAADRKYYGVDYARRGRERPGSDRIDWYRNIPVPTSYMIVDSEQDFFGGYDHSAGAGFVHWAERRVSPGKKLWTWGDAAFGQAWDAHLTDEDGPYIELMAGVYTDNQPDFSWLLPGETKTFTQYWYPIPAIGPAHQATPDAAVNVETSGATLVASVAVTSPRRAVELRVLCGGRVVARTVTDLRPGEVARATAERNPAISAVELVDADGRLLVRWEPASADPNRPEPELATEPPRPEDVDSVEELYLIGLHLSQYRHPTRSPLPYWRAALERDPGDVRTNLAMADRLYRRGRYDRALAHADVALGRAMRRNANPMDAEVCYLRGLILRGLGRLIEAESAFGKAGWDGAWAASAGFALAESLAGRGRDRAALRVVDAVDAVAGHDPRRTALRVILWRRSGLEGKAGALIDEALAADPLDATLRVLAGRLPSDPFIRIDVALALSRAGEQAQALDLLDTVDGRAVIGAGDPAPIARYLEGRIHEAAGEIDAAIRARLRARASGAAGVFPHGLEVLDALERALAAEPDDTLARSLIGAQLYDLGRRREAADQWDEAVRRGSEDPVLLRNAALAAYCVRADDTRAAELYERAIAQAPRDARLRYERDQLAKRTGTAVVDRLAALEGISALVLERDDLAVEYLELLVSAGRAAEARQVLLQRAFQPWEGGEGRVIAVWDAANAALGLAQQEPPASLGEQRSPFSAPAARREDGAIDYFATSLPDMLLFARDTGDD